MWVAGSSDATAKAAVGVWPTEIPGTSIRLTAPGAKRFDGNRAARLRFSDAGTGPRSDATALSAWERALAFATLVRGRIHGRIALSAG
jgi:hypothetical protein